MTNLTDDYNFMTKLPIHFSNILCNYATKTGNKV